MVHRPFVVALIVITLMTAGTPYLFAVESESAGIAWVTWKKDWQGRAATQELWKRGPKLVRQIAPRLGITTEHFYPLDITTEAPEIQTTVQKALESISAAENPMLYFFINTHGGDELLSRQKLAPMRHSSLLRLLLNEIENFEQQHSPHKVTLTIFYSACYAGSMENTLINTAELSDYKNYRINLFMASQANQLHYGNDLEEAFLSLLNDPDAKRLWDKNQNNQVDPEELNALGSFMGHSGIYENFRFYSTYLHLDPQEDALKLYEPLLQKRKITTTQIMAAVGIARSLTSADLRTKMDPDQFQKITDQLAEFTSNTKIPKSEIAYIRTIVSPPTGIPLLIDMAQNDHHSDTRSWALDQLIPEKKNSTAASEIISPDVSIPLLTRIAKKDGDARMRFKAFGRLVSEVEGLRNQPSEKTSAILRQLLSDSPFPEVRVAAADGLKELLLSGQVSDTPIIDSFRIATADKKAAVVAQALHGLAIGTEHRSCDEKSQFLSELKTLEKNRFKQGEVKGMIRFILGNISPC